MPAASGWVPPAIAFSIAMRRNSSSLGAAARTGGLLIKVMSTSGMRATGSE
jgi:hypothetical protein